MKEQILKLRQQGFSIRKIARQLNIGKSTVDYHCNPDYAVKQKVHRNEKRKRLIDSAGGKCKCCGYNKSISALDFHHKDPSQKSFGISEGMRLAYSFERLLEETRKCILLCSNCHHELHDGLITID